MKKSLNKGCVIGFAVAVFALLAIAPRPSSADDPALANQNNTGANGQTMQGNQAYQQGYNQAYNQAYAQKQQQLDNSSSQQSGGCCGGGSGGG